METRYRREACHRGGVEEREVIAVPKVSSQGRIAGRTSSSAIVRQAVSRPNEQVMTSRRNGRAGRNGSDEHWRCTATRAHLEQSIVGSKDMRGVGVVVNLNKLVTRTRRATRSEFGDQDRARLILHEDRSRGCGVRELCVHRIRQDDQERLVHLVLLVVRQDGYGDGLDLFACREVNRAGRGGVVITRCGVLIAAGCCCVVKSTDAPPAGAGALSVTVNNISADPDSGSTSCAS